ncbi:hypothetical protein, partial [Burkholderia gladioli]|uniref:hypothetical protein n=1 Tax=Burkholderia gladioli TaxID=28095 RepID=UPI001ABA0DD0
MKMEIKEKIFQRVLFLNFGAFGRLPQFFWGCDLPDFFGPFQSWRTASVASVEQYRCLNSL